MHSGGRPEVGDCPAASGEGHTCSDNITTERQEESDEKQTAISERRSASDERRARSRGRQEAASSRTVARYRFLKAGHGETFRPKPLRNHTPRSPVWQQRVHVLELVQTEDGVRVGFKADPPLHAITETESIRRSRLRKWQIVTARSQMIGEHVDSLDRSRRSCGRQDDTRCDSTLRRDLGIWAGFEKGIQCKLSSIRPNKSKNGAVPVRDVATTYEKPKTVYTGAVSHISTELDVKGRDVRRTHNNGKTTPQARSTYRASRNE